MSVVGSRSREISRGMVTGELPTIISTRLASVTYSPHSLTHLLTHLLACSLAHLLPYLITYRRAANDDARQTRRHRSVENTPQG